MENLHHEYCQGCLKFNEEQGTCLAFKELWTEWKSADELCWSREEDPKKMLEMLNEVDIYRDTGHDPRRGPNDWRTQIKVLRPKIEALVAEQTNKEIAEVYLEDQKRGKGGGGEKNKDGSAFGPQEHKDNRFLHRNRKGDWSGWRS